PGRAPPGRVRARGAGSAPDQPAPGGADVSGVPRARLDEALALADTAGFPARRAEAARRGKLRGLGVGPYIEGTGGGPQEYAEVRALPEGGGEGPLGSNPQGPGPGTVFAQVVAERLGLPYERVRVVMGDTDRVANGVGTFASRSMVRAGSAAVEAAAALVETGRAMAAQLLEAAAADVTYRDGAFGVVGTDRSTGLFGGARAAAARELPGPRGPRRRAARRHQD